MRMRKVLAKLRSPIPEQRTSSPSLPSEGERAHRQAEENLAAVQAQGPEVSRVARSLRDLRRRNHFAAQIEHLFYGGPS